MKKLKIKIRPGDIYYILDSEYKKNSPSNNTLGEFFLNEIIPYVKSDPTSIESVVKSFYYDSLLLYLLIREVPLSKDSLQKISWVFCNRILGKGEEEKINSYISCSLNEKFPGESFISLLINRQISRLKKDLPEEETEELIEELIISKPKDDYGAQDAYRILIPVLLKKKLISSNKIISLIIKTRKAFNNDYYPSHLHSLLLEETFEKYTEEIDINEILKDTLIKSYYNKDLNGLDGYELLEKSFSLFISKLKLTKDQILCIKNNVDEWFVGFKMRQKFCTLVFTYQTSITSEEVAGWLKIYREKEEEHQKSKAGQIHEHWSH